MLILILILLYPLVVSVTVLELNRRGLVPGTSNYRLLQQARRAEIQSELARSELIAARCRAKENQILDEIKTTRLLEAS